MTPEKLFISVLAAILTAAAVIASVYYFAVAVPEHKKREADEFRQWQEDHRRRSEELDREANRLLNRHHQ